MEAFVSNSWHPIKALCVLHGLCMPSSVSVYSVCLSTFLPCIVLCAAAADSFSVSLSVVMSCCDQPLCFYYCHCFLSVSCCPFLSLLSASVFSHCLHSSAEPQCIMSAVSARHSAVLLFSNDHLPSLLACSVFL